MQKVEIENNEQQEHALLSVTLSLSRSFSHDALLIRDAH